MVEELQENPVSTDVAQAKKRRLQIALVAIFIIAAAIFIGWQMGVFSF